MLKLYYKLYRNRLLSYFDNFLPECGVYGHNLRNDLIRLPTFRCEFSTMNAKYQIHLRLRELANLSSVNAYPPNFINKDTLNKSVHNFSKFLKAEFSIHTLKYAHSLSVMSANLNYFRFCFCYPPNFVCIHIERTVMTVQLNEPLSSLFLSSLYMYYLVLAHPIYTDFCCSTFL